MGEPHIVRPPQSWLMIPLQISRDTWNARVPTITKEASKYQMPVFERAWFLIGLLYARHHIIAHSFLS
jgi:hypothetical protein